MPSPTRSKGGISFEVESGTPVSNRSREAIDKRFKESSSNLGEKRRNLSLENLNSKLDTASERKKRQEESRIKKAKDTYDHAKQVASKVKGAHEAEVAEKREKIEEKLGSAAQLKHQREEEIKSRLEQHSQSVSVRREAYNQDYPSPGRQEIKEKLTAAEERRRQLEEDRLKSVAQHLKTVEERKNLSDLKSPVKSQQLTKKLTSAEERRKEQEKALQNRLNAAEEHGKMVRQRKSERSSLA